MQVQIDLEELDPPAGAIQIEGREQRSFVGWLGLIHGLEEFIGSPTT